MSKRKVYGEYQTSSCPFCNKIATTKNDQGVPVCTQHRSTFLEDMRCVCKSWLDIKQGKYGAFALCERCGAMSLSKALAMTGGAKVKPTQESKQQKSPFQKPSFSRPEPRILQQKKGETVITSDELDFL